MINFNNTEVAFSSKSNAELKKAYWLFKLLAFRWLVVVGQLMTNIALALRIPISWAVKPTIFSQFCGGEDIEECTQTMIELQTFDMGAILDYSVEGAEEEASYEYTANEIIHTIEKAAVTPNITFAVFKVSGLANTEFLTRANEGFEKLDTADTERLNHVRSLVNLICKTAYDNNIRVLVDAEESWIQNTIDWLADEMMMAYNQETAIVYNTIQLYRHDRLQFLKQSHLLAQEKKYILGVKLVRGAYMEKERIRAEKMGYLSPIQPNKEASDRDFNASLLYCLDNIDEIHLCCGTHNEESNTLLVNEMANRDIKSIDPRIHFAQLYGMSDHISYNLVKMQYNVSKYLPYGPINSVIPYLIRRAQENTSVKGQTGRELGLIQQELERRKIIEESTTYPIEQNE